MAAKGSAASTGDVFYDTTLNVVKYFDTAWRTVPTRATSETLSNKTITAYVLDGFDVGTSAKSANYTVLSTDSESTFLGTAGASDITFTLPSAASVGDRIFTFKKVDAGAGRVLVSGSIDGNSTIVVPLQYDYVKIQSDGTNYHIIGRKSTTTWASYTPSFSSGFGTVANNNAFWRRSGDMLEVRGTVEFGTVTANLGSIRFPQTYFNLNTSVLSENNTNAAFGESVGFLTQDGGIRHGNIVTAPASVTNFVYLCGVQDVAGSNLIPQNVSVTWASGDDAAYWFKVPISEWADS